MITRYALLAFLWLSPLVGHAAIIDYTIFAVGGSPDGNSDAIYGYTALNATPTMLIDVPSPSLGYVNGLATDYANNRLLMIRDGLGGGGSNLYALNMTTLAFTNLGSINTPNIQLVTSSGGGSFYNGSYYYWDDQAGGTGTNMGLVRVDFASGGSISVVNQIWVNDGGDFGDFAIDKATGVLYGTSNLPGGTGTSFEFWSLNLNNIGAGRTVLASNVAYQQLAFDNLGNLIGVELDSASGNTWYTVNRTNGAVLSSITRPVLPGTNFNVYDLADGGIYAIPEPATTSLLAMVAMGGFCWYRRRK